MLCFVTRSTLVKFGKLEEKSSSSIFVLPIQLVPRLSTSSDREAYLLLVVDTLPPYFALAPLRDLAIIFWLLSQQLSR